MKQLTTVRATRDFLVGPRRETVIKKGEVHKVDIDDEGNFWTTTEKGHHFGTCNVSRGWEIIEERMNNQEIEKRQAFIIHCSTGCSCCNNQNYWVGLYDSLDAVVDDAKSRWRRKSLCSQYSSNGEYYIHEIEIEDISHNRVIIENKLVFYKDDYIGEDTESCHYGKQVGIVSSNPFRDTKPGEFHLYEEYKKTLEYRAGNDSALV